VFAILLQNAFETTTPFTDDGRLRDFRPRLIAYQVLNTHMLLFKKTVDGLYLPISRYTVAVDFIQQSVQTDSAQQFILKFP